MSVQLRERRVMIVGVKDQTVVGKDDAFGVPFSAVVVDVAFIVCTAVFPGQNASGHSSRIRTGRL